MVGIVKDGNIIYEKYRGLSNLQDQINNSAKTRSNIASTAKQFTALMILQMDLEGKLSLEDDIRQHLPELYPKVQDSIKIRHLINHSSGIRDYVELMSLQNRIWWKQLGLDNKDVMELMVKQEDLGFKPGARYAYSNSNYNILAEVIEKVSNQPFNDYSKKFFEKLGMKETAFVKRYMGVIPNRANPYSDWGDGEWLQTPTLTKTNGEGFLYTTLKDQLVFEQALQGAHQTKNQLLIKSQEPIPHAEIKEYGFGLKLSDRLNYKAVHHDGVTAGYHAQALRFPEERISIFVMGNNGNVRSDLLADEIAGVFLPQRKPKVSYDKEFKKRSNRSKNPKIVDQYYTPNGSLIRIVEEEGKIVYRQGKSTRIELIKEGEDTYYPDYDPSNKLVFYDDKVVVYRPDGRTTLYSRSKDKAATMADLEGFKGTYYNSELDLGLTIETNKEGKLGLLFLNDAKDLVKDIEVYNRAVLLAGSNLRLTAERDSFDRVIAMKLTYDRAINMRFKKKNSLQFQPKIATDFGSIQVTTIRGRNSESSTILLTKNDPRGNEISSKRFGGESYDKASSILATEDGYLIIGSTSSYGKGNYDVFVIKIDKEGNQLWQNTYGDFFNEYGYSAEKIEGGYLIKGTIQRCESRDVVNSPCRTNVWFITIDEKGQEVKSKILEEVD